MTAAHGAFCSRKKWAVFANSRERRWRASRYGLEGKLIDFGRHREVETRSLINEILEIIAPKVEELGSVREMAHMERILREGTGADRQLAAWEVRHEVKDVVDQIVAETYEGLKIDQAVRLLVAEAV